MRNKIFIDDNAPYLAWQREKVRGALEGAKVDMAGVQDVAGGVKFFPFIDVSPHRPSNMYSQIAVRGDWDAVELQIYGPFDYYEEGNKKQVENADLFLFNSALQKPVLGVRVHPSGKNRRHAYRFTLDIPWEKIRVVEKV